MSRMPKTFASSRCIGAAAMLLLLMLAGCADQPGATSEAGDLETIEQHVPIPDPIEPVNRALYFINGGIYRFVLGPIAYGYRHMVPEPVRRGVHNVLRNALAPVDFANHVLQGKACRAGDTALRFLINTTFGLGGLVDLATLSGIPAHETDFGVTLGTWGVGSGPYLFIPVITSSSLRDLTGTGVDFAADPWSWAVHGEVVDAPDWGRMGAYANDETEEWIDEMRKVSSTALDPYVVFRSTYQQSREFQVSEALKPDRGVVCGDGNGRLSGSEAGPAPRKAAAWHGKIASSFRSPH
jgi:phospholipid-binding lipoprotein MlaA